FSIVLGGAGGGTASFENGDSATAGIMSETPGLPLCKLDPMSHAGPRFVQCPGAKFKHASRPAARKANPPGPHVGHAIDDDPAIVERDHVNRKAHPERMDAAGG